MKNCGFTNKPRWLLLLSNALCIDIKNLDEQSVVELDEKPRTIFLCINHGIENVDLHFGYLNMNEYRELTFYKFPVIFL